MSEGAVSSGEALYFDGIDARRRPVTVEVRAGDIAILADGNELAVWRLTDLHRADAPKGVMRIGADGAPELARIEIRDPALQTAIAKSCPALGGRRRGGEATARQIVFWSLAAVVSLVLTVVFLVPLMADRIAPFVPIPIERRIGEAVDNQVRTLFGGEPCALEPGTTALARLGERLTGAVNLPMPVDIAVLPSQTVNAVALPGGRVYVFKGLLDAADSPDELAGVLAHELGHVANRDGLRKLIETSGSAFLLGLLFGDVTGGGAIVLAAQMLVDSRYSREAESAADAFSSKLLLELGRSPKPLGIFLNRIDHGGGEFLAFLSSHPVSAERLRALEANDRPATGTPLLDSEAWQALKAICSSSVSP